jgi:hypothetical protein
MADLRMLEKWCRSAFKAGYEKGVKCDKSYDAATEFNLWWKEASR